MLIYSNLNKSDATNALFDWADLFISSFVSKQEPELIDLLFKKCNLGLFQRYDLLFGLKCNVDWLIMPRNQQDFEEIALVWHEFCDRFCEPRKLKLNDRQKEISTEVAELKRELDISSFPKEQLQEQINSLKENITAELKDLGGDWRIGGIQALVIPQTSPRADAGTDIEACLNSVAQRMGIQRSQMISLSEIESQEEIDAGEIESKINQLEQEFSALFTEPYEYQPTNERTMSAPFCGELFASEICFDIVPYAEFISDLSEFNYWKMQIDPRKKGKEKLRLRKTRKPHKHDREIAIL